MRKIICLIFLAGLLVFVSGAIAAEQKYSLPDGERATLGGGRIYLMYDLETGALCYITSLGGIDCTHHGNLAISDRFSDITKKARSEYKKRNLTAPHMVIIDVDTGSVKEDTESKKKKKREDL